MSFAAQAPVLRATFHSIVRSCTAWHGTGVWRYCDDISAKPCAFEGHQPTMSAATNISVSEALHTAAASHAETVEFRRRMSTISRQSVVFFSGTLFSAMAGYFFKIYLARALGA